LVFLIAAQALTKRHSRTILRIIIRKNQDAQFIIDFINKNRDLIEKKNPLFELNLFSLFFKKKYACSFKKINKHDKKKYYNESSKKAGRV